MIWNHTWISSFPRAFPRERSLMYLKFSQKTNRRRKSFRSFPVLWTIQTNCFVSMLYIDGIVYAILSSLIFSWIYVFVILFALWSGVDLGFSRKEADFQKNFEMFDNLFLGRKTWFCKPLEKIFGKQVKKSFLGTFWKILTKKTRFFWRALPLKISIY